MKKGRKRMNNWKIQKANAIHNPQLSEEQTVKLLGAPPTETSEYQTPPTDTSLSEVPMDETPATSTRTTNASVTQHAVLRAPPIEGRPTGSQGMGFHGERTPDPEIFFEIVAATRPVTRLAPVVTPVPSPIQEAVVQNDGQGNDITNEPASKANTLVAMGYPELAAASALCSLKESGEKSHHGGEDSKADTKIDPSINEQCLIIEEPPSMDALTQRSASKGAKGDEVAENVEDNISEEGISKGGSPLLKVVGDWERELTTGPTETKSSDAESTQKMNETYQKLKNNDNEAGAEKERTELSNSSEKGAGDKSHASSTKRTEKYSDSIAGSSSEDQLVTPTTEEDELMGHQSTNVSNSHSAQTFQSGGSVQSATPTDGVGSRPIDTQTDQGNNQVDVKQHAQNAQPTNELEQLPDNELRELASKLGLHWRQDQVSGLTREQLISTLKLAHEAGGASWAQFWRSLSLSHTSRLPNSHVFVRLSQRFSAPKLELPLGEHDIVQGQTSQPRYKGIPISVVESQRPGRAINYYNHACLIIDPCTMKSVGDWKLVTKTQPYSARIQEVGSEPRSITQDALLDRDERKLVHFATTKDLSNGFITRVSKSGSPEVIWDEKQKTRLDYLGDFPFQAYWGGQSYHQRITLGMIPIVDDLFPQHIPGPLASGTEIRLVLGQDFIEHKQYYKYVIERETQDLTIDWDFQVYRNPNINMNGGQQTMRCFVDGFYRDGAEWAAMYHVTGSWFNGIVLLASDSTNMDKPVFITVKALWKALMQAQELMMRLVGSKPLPLQLIIYYRLYAK
ncbi:hypothetical protein L211DRAFT_416329 [Terfezia boudieri ATCC MYA-4762]|uniref:Uncharacterized protein n=1 Tax=Terfezia boudieri ATCC MYA-4762 TaxID=1051890 RepID=A0A3N4LFS6_9PEZI|nr:hypothetical protein L211DRAFT_416329 [Terfezia boudieri ATCC MYA-4762]